MAFVIAHAELVGDQTRHPQTGPQRCREAMCFGALAQHCFQAFELLGVQQRLAAGAAGLAESGRAERYGFEYKRNGTLSLYAALNTKAGQVQGKTAARHTSQEFVSFLHEVVSGCEPQREIHFILDNLSAHKTKKVAEFLEQPPNVALHFTPTYSSWLNQVELWFSKVQRDVIARGVFTSTADLARKLRRYINAYSKDAQPFRWKYSKPSRRIRHGKTISATVH